MDATHRAESVAVEEPLLGLATTRQLLEELAVRFDVTTPEEVAWGVVVALAENLPKKVLDYRTVDSDG